MSGIELNVDEFNPQLFGQSKDDDDEVAEAEKNAEHVQTDTEDESMDGITHERHVQPLLSTDDSNSASISFSKHYENQHSQSRRKNVHKNIREEIEEDPALYGIRRSGRSRKEPTRYEIKEEEHRKKPTRRLRISSTDLTGDSSDSGEGYMPKRHRYKRKNGHARTIRTRGNRVSYKEASDNSDADSYSDESDESVERSRRAKNNSVMTQRPTNKQHPLLGGRPNFEKPRGSLVRSAIDRQKPRVKYTDDQSDASNGESDSKMDVTTNPVRHSDSEEINVIEDVVRHRTGRKGATGDPSTLYNVREKDPNADFDAATEEGELQFLIKWKTWSHIHNTWESMDSLSGRSDVNELKKVQAYKATLADIENWKKGASSEELEAAAYEEERNEILQNQKQEVERIVTHFRSKQGDDCDYYIKWKCMEYCLCTWEDGNITKDLFPTAVEEYDARCKSLKTPNKKCEALRVRPRFVALKSQPEYIAPDNPDAILRDYQLDGVNWIARAWTRGNSVILADEMGLGKTIQTISYLSYLFHEHNIYGPFLIVVPLSTIGSWVSEFSIWAPDMNVIVYTGSCSSRQIIRDCEWSFPHKQMLKFNVCITTNEYLLKDKAWLGQVSWAFLGVDEAHRLKNDANQLYKVLIDFDTNTRLLVTGTPLQNSMRELWALLHFIMPQKFDIWEDFQEMFHVDEAGNEVAFSMLHKALEPFMLRRVKKDVEKSLPEKIEQILRVEMSSLQKRYYKWILAKNYEALSKETRGRATFVNIIMELKKCCNHPYLIAPPDEGEDQQFAYVEALKKFTKASGKMMLLDKLLLRLKNSDHRVLIFSQMVRMLDIIADYLVLRGWAFQRLDGSIRGDVRKQALDHFNAEGSTDFCFLLSTRAGGLGVNLATADTVIIFDSDWNPQNDLQAQARAHRIGQKKQVSVYRFVTKHSVEEEIIEKAKKKMVLNHLVIQSMNTTGKPAVNKNRVDGKSQPFTGDELKQILKFGAEALFKENEEKDEDEINIDEILNFAEARDTEAEVEQQNPNSGFLSQFKVLNMDINEDEDNAKVNWAEIIPEDYRQQIHEEKLLECEMGPRQRRQVKHFRAGGYESEEEDDDSSSEDEKRKSGKITDKDIRSLIKTMKRFARPLERIDSIIAEAEIPEYPEKDVRDVMEQIIQGCRKSIEDAKADQSTAGDESNITGVSMEDNKASGKGLTFQIGRISVPAKPFIQSIMWLDILHETMPVKHEDRLKFKLPFSTKLVNWTCEWDSEDDSRLLVGVYEHGMDNWESIKMDPELHLSSKILHASSSERPQSSHLRTRLDYLLKMLKKSHSDSAKPTSALPFKVAPVKPKKETETKHAKRKLVVSSAEPSSTSKPKSKEFIDTSDTSNSSDDDSGSGGLKTGDKANNKKTKKREAKSSAATAKPAGDDQPPAKKKKPNEIAKKSKASAGPVHYTASKEGDQTKKAEEEVNYFKNMKGPIFDRCKEKMRPIRKYIKKLEGADVNDMDEGLQACLLKIGDHINKIIHEFKDKTEVRKWRNYLWFFVNVFTQLTDSQLHQIYKEAYKERAKTGKGEPDESGKHHRHHHHHHHHGHHHHHHNHQQKSGGDGGEAAEGVQSSRHSQGQHRGKNAPVHHPESTRNSGGDCGQHYQGDRQRNDSRTNYASSHKDKDYDSSRFDNAYNRLPNQNYSGGGQSWRSSGNGSRYGGGRSGGGYSGKSSSHNYRPDSSYRDYRRERFPSGGEFHSSGSSYDRDYSSRHATASYPFNSSSAGPIHHKTAPVQSTSSGHHDDGGSRDPRLSGVSHMFAVHQTTTNPISPNHSAY